MENKVNKGTRDESIEQLQSNIVDEGKKSSPSNGKFRDIKNPREVDTVDTVEAHSDEIVFDENDLENPIYDVEVFKDAKTDRKYRRAFKKYNEDRRFIHEVEHWKFHDEDFERRGYI